MSGQSLRGDGPVRQDTRASAGWDQALARHLVSWAARNAPPGLTGRLQEEWLADLTARKGAFSRIRFGLGCCWATRIIAREFGAAAVAASSASGEQLLAAHGGYDFSRVSRRTIALIAIVCLHVGIFYLYLSGFTGTIVVDRVDPLAGGVITDVPRQRQPTPLPPPTLSHTIVESLPTPVLAFNLPADPTTITVAHSPRPNVGPAQLPPPQPVTRVTGGPGTGFPDTEDYYPPSARRLGEAGAAAVQVCVDPRGRLTADPAILQSSGIAQLDQGALRLAKAGSGHYRPTTENGQPVSSCYAFRIKFQLEDQ